MPWSLAIVDGPQLARRLNVDETGHGAPKANTKQKIRGTRIHSRQFSIVVVNNISMFLVFLGRIFLQNCCVRKVQKYTGFWRFFFVSRNSHEKKEHAVEHAIFSSRQYAGLIHFARKIPTHFVRIASSGIKMPKHMVLQIQLTNCKKHMFFAVSEGPRGF